MRSIHIEKVGKQATAQQYANNFGAEAEYREVSADIFNSRGTVASPAFEKDRQKSSKDQIASNVKAHPLASDQWIAEPSWHCNSGHTPGHYQQPASQSTAFHSSGDAVHDVLVSADAELTHLGFVLHPVFTKGISHTFRAGGAA